MMQAVEGEEKRIVENESLGMRNLSNEELERRMVEAKRQGNKGMYQLYYKEFDRRCSEALDFALGEVDRQNRERNQRRRDRRLS